MSLGTACLRIQPEISSSSVIRIGHRSVPGRLIPIVWKSVTGTCVPNGVSASTSPARSGPSGRGGRSRSDWWPLVVLVDRGDRDRSDGRLPELRVVGVKDHPGQWLVLGVLPVGRLQPLDPLHEFAARNDAGPLRARFLSHSSNLSEVSEAGISTSLAASSSRGPSRGLDFGKQRVLKRGSEGDQSIGGEQRHLPRHRGDSLHNRPGVREADLLLKVDDGTRPGLVDDEQIGGLPDQLIGVGQA